MGFDELVQHDLSEMTTGIGNGLTGGNGSPVGIADGGVGNAEIDNSAAFQFNGDLTLGQATTNYVLQQGPFSGSLEVRAQSDNNVRFSLRDAKNDGSNTITYSISPNGNAGTTDFQVGEFVHNAGGNRYSIRTRSGGTKTARPIHLRPNQTTAFVARTDGNVAMNNRLLVGNTGAATSALNVSGGAVVGSGFAGSNTAPTDGLLVEGLMKVKDLSAPGNYENVISGKNAFNESLFLSRGSTGSGVTVLAFGDRTPDKYGEISFRGDISPFRAKAIVNSTDVLVLEGSGDVIAGNGTIGADITINDLNTNFAFHASTAGVLSEGASQIGTGSGPGSSSSPILALGASGAGLFVDSNGDIVAQDESGNTTVLT